MKQYSVDIYTRSEVFNCATFAQTVYEAVTSILFQYFKIYGLTIADIENVTVEEMN